MRLFGQLSELTKVIWRKASGKAVTLDIAGASGSTDRTVLIPDPVNADRELVTTDHSQTLTNKTLDADLNTISNIENADIKAAAAIDATKVANGSVSNTEFQYLDGVTSSIQTQLNNAGTDLSNHLSDATDAHDASAISNVPNGVGISATDVQAALNELDTEKQPIDADLTALAALATTGLIARTGAGTVATRTITGSATVDVDDGDGVAANPTLSVIESGLTLNNIGGTLGGTKGGTGVSNSGTLNFGTQALTLTTSATSNVTIPAGTTTMMTTDTNQSVSGIKTLTNGAIASDNVTFATTKGIESQSAASTLNVGTTNNTTTLNLGTAGGTQTVNIGTGAGVTTINIGGAGDTVNISGTLTTVNTATLEVTDQNVVVNKGGSDGSAEGAGLTVDRVGTDGSLIYDSTLASKWKAGDLGSEVQVATVSHTQTLSNKTLVQPLVDNFLDINEESVPGTPAANTVRVYAKTDGKLYKKDDTGLETSVGGGGLDPVEVSSSVTPAVIGTLYLCNTSGGAFGITLPAGSTKAAVGFVDARETWGTNNLTITPATGEKIDGYPINEALVLDVSGGWVTLTWSVADARWTIQSSAPGSSNQAIVHNGNTLGANMVIGTNDNFSFNIETNGTTKVAVGANGILSASNGSAGGAVQARFNSTNPPGSLSYFCSNGNPYLGFNTSQTPSTDGQTYTTTNPASRVVGPTGSGALTMDVAASGTAGNAITWINALTASSAGAVTLGASGTTSFHTLQGSTAADFQVKITNSNGTNGSGLRVQADGAGSTAQSWFTGATNLGSVVTSGQWTFGTGAQDALTGTIRVRQPSDNPAGGIVLNSTAVGQNGAMFHNSVSLVLREGGVDSLSINAGAITLDQIHNTTTGNINSGRYTPTITSVTNITGSPGAQSVTYTRVGNIVTLTGYITAITAIAAASTVTVLEVSLPIASNLTAGNDALGTGAFWRGSATVACVPCIITANVVNDRIKIEWQAPTTNNGEILFTAQYEVK